MPYATKVQVKAYLEIKTSEISKDDLIDALIGFCDEFINEYCNRTFTQAAVTEYHDGGSNKVFLNRFPVASSPAVQVWDSWDRSYASTDLIDSDDYFVDTENGILKFDYDIGGSPGAVKVTYTGGYSTIPGPITQACIELVARKLKEGPSGGVGVPSRSLPNGGSVTFEIGALLSQTKIALDAYSVLP